MGDDRLRGNWGLEDAFDGGSLWEKAKGKDGGASKKHRQKVELRVVL